MTTSKDLGIWMDHSNANLMEYTTDPIEIKTIPSQNETKENSQGSSENATNNKEQHRQSDFYKRLGETIRNYDSIVLFGPTNAKTELYNILKDDHRFAKIKIEVRPADKMTENQQHAFVKEYFSKN
jgi:stalled ribosome rescue protein Dom34